MPQIQLIIAIIINYKLIKEAYSKDVAIRSSHNHNSTVTENLQNYRFERRVFNDTDSENDL